MKMLFSFLLTNNQAPSGAHFNAGGFMKNRKMWGGGGDVPYAEGYEPAHKLYVLDDHVIRVFEKTD